MPKGLPPAANTGASALFTSTFLTGITPKSENVTCSVPAQLPAAGTALSGELIQLSSGNPAIFISEFISAVITSGSCEE